jgi:hypothetical protein
VPDTLPCHFSAEGFDLREGRGAAAGSGGMERKAGSGEAEALKRLETLRPRHQRLVTERIRAEADVERLAAELEAARARARAELGTDDEDALRRMIAEAQAENARAVEDFAAQIQAIDARLRRLAQEG